ncbi:transmembrane transporter [Malassezia pachydermatis]
MVSNLTATLTNNTGSYALTAQEDNAVLEVLTRAHKAGFVDYGRAIMYRSASDFDRGM